MKKILMSLVLAALCFAPLQSQAAETDMATIPCKEFMAVDQNQKIMLLFWIDGYMSAMSENTVISDEWTQKLGMHMGQYCTQNPDNNIMQAMDAMPAE